MKICAAEGCARVVHSHGYCKTHDQRLRRKGSPEAEIPIHSYTPSEEQKRLKKHGRLRCSICRKILVHSCFAPTEWYGKQHRCRNCRSSQGAARSYNITKDQYWRMRARQGNRCAICNNVFGRGGTRCCVDHDHADGKIRGLLCDRCNIGIGSMRDSPALLYMAARYLDDAEMRKKEIVVRRINKRRIRG